MISFRYRYFRKDHTPVVTDLEIQSYAEAILSDYKPQLLREPGRINGLHFLESYLGATVEFMDIYCPEGTKIAGATVFNDEKVLIFDREHLCIRPVSVKADTILIDNETMNSANEAFALFTQLHEGGHFCMHREVYKKKAATDGIVSCRRSSIEEPRRQLQTEQDFREHQANTFAAALAMPRPVFIPLARELFLEEGQTGGIWYEPDMEYPGYSYMGLTRIISELSCIFGTSESAIRVQLQRQGLLRRLHNRRPASFSGLSYADFTI